MRHSFGACYSLRDDRVPVIPTFHEEILLKKGGTATRRELTTDEEQSVAPSKSFETLWSLMDTAHEQFANDFDGKVLTSTINQITLTDVITMVKYNMDNTQDLEKALKSSSITDVATKVTLIFKPVVRWKVKLHVFMGKNTYNELVHYHPYKMSTRVLSGSFVNHSYNIRDPIQGDKEEELQNEYLIPNAKRADTNGKAVVYNGKKHVSLNKSRRCEAGSVQEYPIEEAHSLEYDSIANGKVMTVAFISPTILPESIGYDNKDLTETRRLGFVDKAHLYDFLDETLFHLYLIQLKNDLCSSLAEPSRTLSAHEEYLQGNLHLPNSMENVILPVLAEFILQNDEENHRCFSTSTNALFFRIVQETSCASIFKAIVSCQQRIEDMSS